MKLKPYTPTAMALDGDTVDLLRHALDLVHAAGNGHDRIPGTSGPRYYWTFRVEGSRFRAYENNRKGVDFVAAVTCVGCMQLWGSCEAVCHALPSSAHTVRACPAAPVHVQLVFDIAWHL